MNSPNVSPQLRQAIRHLQQVKALTRTPRKLTLAQRIRNRLRALVGLGPKPGDEPTELPEMFKNRPLPESSAKALTFRRTLPPEWKSVDEYERDVAAGKISGVLLCGSVGKIQRRGMADQAPTGGSNEHR